MLLLCGTLGALSLSDFVPSFLEGSNRNDESNTVVKPFVEIKRNASSTKTWYCTRMQNNVSNVFCDRESVAVAKSIVYGNKKSDNTKIIDDAASSNGAINQNMNQRLSTFQDPKVTNLLTKDQDQIQNSALIPLQPSENVHMGVNAEQVQVNIKY